MGAVGNYINSLKQFKKLFWVVIALEGLERGSFYGMMAMLVIHWKNNLSIEADWIGSLMFPLLLLLYLVPIFSAVVGERIGYKKVLLFAFTLYAFGFILLALPGLVFFLPTFSTYVYLWFPVLAIGVAGGTFKPIVSATIAKTTREEQRNFAYSIYYWIINVGAFLIPLSIGLAFISISEEFIPIIFIVSAFILAVAFLITFKFYSNPAPPDSEKDLLEYLIGIARHMITDWRFTLLLLIYSGFWFLFGQNHSYLPLYMYDFNIMPAWFNAGLLASINPFIIILTGPFLAKFVEKHDSLHLMMLGMSIFIFGFCLLGLIPLGITLVLGIVIFSIGEFLTHPNFIAYVSKIAPKDKLAIYMGIIFLPMAIGLPIGSLVGGILYKHIAEGGSYGAPGRPTLYWAINISIVVFVLLMFLLYNRFVAPGLGKYDKPKVTAVDDDEEPVEVKPVVVPSSKAFGDRIINSNFTPIIIALCIPLILFLGYSYGTVGYFPDGSGEGGGDIVEFDISTYNLTSRIEMEGGGILNEGGQNEHNFVPGLDSDQLISTVTITVRWEDEPDETGPLGIVTYENQPDTFSMDVTYAGDEGDPEGTSFTSSEGPSSNGHGSPGVLTFFHEFEPKSADSKNGTGSWNIVVTLEDAGDYEGTVRTLQDDGNDYSLEVTLKLYTPKEEE